MRVFLISLKIRSTNTSYDFLSISFRIANFFSLIVVSKDLLQLYFNYQDDIFLFFILTTPTITLLLTSLFCPCLLFTREKKQ